MKLYKKIAMYALVATLSLGTFGVLSLSAKGANGDYDVSLCQSHGNRRNSTLC